MTGPRTSRRHRARRFAGVAGAGIMVLLAAPVAGIKVIDYLTTRQAQAIVVDLEGATPQETTLNVARWVATEFEQGVLQPTWYRKYGFVLSQRIRRRPGVGAEGQRLCAGDVLIK